MATLDEYIDQLLAVIADENSAQHHVVQNILDEHIPDFVGLNNILFKENTYT